MAFEIGANAIDEILIQNKLEVDKNRDGELTD
jgi:hypothetical protein